MSDTIKKIIAGVLLLIIGGLLGTGVTITLNPSSEVTRTETEQIIVEAPSSTLELSEQQVPTIIENDRGELSEELYPTVEEVDGGQLEDEFTGLSISGAGNYADLGWSETYDVSSPEAFKEATLWRCVIANNIFGAQCVSLARVFWWSYADRDISTCGTGAAKGMMNCSDDNAGDDFVVIPAANINEIQAGDWLVFTGGLYGHVGMALGPASNGYVALLGENQGGASCGANVGGSATNIINISVKNLIGIYRPKAYVKPAPAALPDASH